MRMSVTVMVAAMKKRTILTGIDMKSEKTQIPVRTFMISCDLRFKT